METTGATDPEACCKVTPRKWWQHTALKQTCFLFLILCFGRSLTGSLILLHNLPTTGELGHSGSWRVGVRARLMFVSDPAMSASYEKFRSKTKS